MNDRAWLKRRYPITFNEVNEFLNDEKLSSFKSYNYKLGILTEDIYSEEIYEKGNLCMFKRANPIYDFNYPLHTVIVKCIEGLTTSGYNSVWVSPNQVNEIKQ